VSSGSSPAFSASPADRRAGGEDAAAFVRGSSLLLAARIAAQGTEFGLQLFLIRYLTKSDYGAFAYALSIVLLLRAVAVFELPVTLARFLPLYRVQERYGALVGSVALGVGVVAGLGTFMALAGDAGVLLLHFQPTDDHQALVLLAILLLVVPVEALDILLTSLFATFATTRTIFIRQAIVGPGLKLALVVGVVATHAGVVTVALGYLASDLLCLVVYGWLFLLMLKRQPTLTAVRRKEFSYPVRATLGFAAPLLAGTLVWLLMESSDAILLGYFRSTQEVAAFRAVLLVALVSQGVTNTFTLLYTPMLARLYALKDHAKMSELYWRATQWVTILSFPVFILTFSFAASTTGAVVGARYADSAGVMEVLAFGYFFHASLGFNGLTLRVFGRLRYSVSIDFAAAVVNVLINLLLIPRWGALGAAVGTASTMVVHNILKQYGLWRYTGINLFARSYLPTYLSSFGIAAALLVLQTALSANILVALSLTLVATLAVAWISRGGLQVDEMFPELARWPVTRMLLQPSRSL
jgi:O-antigen/teichoic acid export membrane protein